MKSKLINFSISLIFVLCGGIIFTLLFSFLCYFKIISKESNETLLYIISLFLFFMFGFIFGYKEKSRGLVNGLLLSAIYILIYFMITSLEKNLRFSPNALMITKCFLLIGGSYIGSLFNRIINP